MFFNSYFDTFYLICDDFLWIHFSYECPDFSKYDKNRCYINGKSFKVGEEIPEDDTPHCRAACRCDKRDEPTAHIECANIECPELFQQNRNWNCVDQYDDLKKCCRSSEICGKYYDLQKFLL